MNTCSMVDAGGTAWEVRADFFESFGRLCRLGISGAMAGPGVSTVKRTPERAIFRVELPGGAVYCKQYRAAGLWARIKALAGLEPARREWRVSLWLEERGVSVPQPLAVGRRRTGVWDVESWFLTREIPQVVPVETLVRGNEGKDWAAGGPAQRHALARNMARCLAGMHRSGLLHRDLHPGNLLVRPGDYGASTVYLTDFHRVSLVCAPGRARRWANLAMFNIFFHDHATAAQRLCFLLEYLERSGDGRRALREAAETIERETRRLRRRLCRRRVARIGRSRRWYERVRGEGFCLHLSKPWGRESLCLLARRMSVPEFWRDVHLVENTGAVMVARIPGAPLGLDCDLRLVRYRIRSWPERILEQGGSSRALKAWKRAHEIRIRNFETPFPVAAVEFRRGGMLRESCYVSQWAENRETLEVFLARRWTAMDGRVRDRFADAFCHYVNRLHRQGLDYRGLDGGGILVAGAEAFSWRWMLLDPLQMRFPKVVPVRCSLENWERVRRTTDRYFDCAPAARG